MSLSYEARSTLFMVIAILENEPGQIDTVMALARVTSGDTTRYGEVRAAILSRYPNKNLIAFHDAERSRSGVIHKLKELVHE